MNIQPRPFPTLLTCAAGILALIIVYLTNFVLVPDFDAMSDAQIQAWVSGPFVPLAYAMIGLILVAMILLGWVLVMQLPSKRPLGKVWFVGAVITIFLFFLALGLTELGGERAVISGTLDPEAALQGTHDWVFFHQATIAIVCFVGILLLIYFAVAIATRNRSLEPFD